MWHTSGESRAMTGGCSALSETKYWDLSANSSGNMGAPESCNF